MSAGSVQPTGDGGKSTAQEAEDAAIKRVEAELFARRMRRLSEEREQLGITDEPAASARDADAPHTNILSEAQRRAIDKLPFHMRMSARFTAQAQAAGLLSDDSARSPNSAIPGSPRAPSRSPSPVSLASAPPPIPQAILAQLSRDEWKEILATKVVPRPELCSAAAAVAASDGAASVHSVLCELSLPDQVAAWMMVKGKAVGRSGRLRNAHGGVSRSDASPGGASTASPSPARHASQPHASPERSRSRASPLRFATDTHHGRAGVGWTPPPSTAGHVRFPSPATMVAVYRRAVVRSRVGTEGVAHATLAAATERYLDNRRRRRSPEEGLSDNDGIEAHGGQLGATGASWGTSMIASGADGGGVGVPAAARPSRARARTVTAPPRSTLVLSDDVGGAAVTLTQGAESGGASAPRRTRARSLTLQVVAPAVTPQRSGVAEVSPSARRGGGTGDGTDSWAVRKAEAFDVASRASAEAVEGAGGGREGGGERPVGPGGEGPVGPGDRDGGGAVGGVTHPTRGSATMTPSQRRANRLAPRGAACSTKGQPSKRKDLAVWGPPLPPPTRKLASGDRPRGVGDKGGASRSSRPTSSVFLPSGARTVAGGGVMCVGSGVPKHSLAQSRQADARAVALLQDAHAKATAELSYRVSLLEATYAQLEACYAVVDAAPPPIPVHVLRMLGGEECGNDPPSVASGSAQGDGRGVRKGVWAEWCASESARAQAEAHEREGGRAALSGNFQAAEGKVLCAGGGRSAVQRAMKSLVRDTRLAVETLSFVVGEVGGVLVDLDAAVTTRGAWVPRSVGPPRAPLGRGGGMDRVASLRGHRRSYDAVGGAGGSMSPRSLASTALSPSARGPLPAPSFGGGDVSPGRRKGTRHGGVGRSLSPPQGQPSPGAAAAAASAAAAAAADAVAALEGRRSFTPPAAAAPSPRSARVVTPVGAEMAATVPRIPMAQAHLQSGVRGVSAGEGGGGAVFKPSPSRWDDDTEADLLESEDWLRSEGVFESLSRSLAQCIFTVTHPTPPQRSAAHSHSRLQGPPVLGNIAKSAASLRSFLRSTTIAVATSNEAHVAAVVELCSARVQQSAGICRRLDALASLAAEQISQAEADWTRTLAGARSHTAHSISDAVERVDTDIARLRALQETVGAHIADAELVTTLCRRIANVLRLPLK